MNKYSLLFLVFVATFIFVELMLQQQVENYAVYENNEKLNDILINQKALHTYVEEMQKPVIYKLKQEKKLYSEFFDPNVLSFTYIARNIHQIENKLLQDANKTQKYYKLASTNPRNALNKANEFEKELIKKFNASDLQEFKEMIEEGGQKFLYYAKPVGRNKESCMRCHSAADIAPQELLKIYGDKKGFNEHIGDIRAIISIKIPLQKELENAKTYYNIITAIIFVSLLFIYVVIVFLMKQLDAKQNKLEDLVNVDELTKCYNRRSFEFDLNNQIEQVKRTKTELSLISFDIDYFKAINDDYGHLVGDTVLINLCKIVQLRNRKYDRLYRVGGEEFMIVLPNTTLENALLIAERIRMDVETYKIRDRVVTISLGACQHKQEDDFTKLYKKVDAALYKAKNNGRNRVESCQEEILTFKK